MIKATDLMLGDWVYVNGEPARITVLGSNQVGGTWTSSITFLYSEERAYQIPLTRELLKECGFTRTVENSTVFWNTKNGFSLVEGCGVFWTDGIGGYAQIGSVHELQHALRLCGQRKTADGIQIDYTKHNAL